MASTLELVLLYLVAAAGGGGGCRRPELPPLLDGKLQAILLFSQHIYVFNIYTQELIVDLTPADRQKYTTIIFMDSKNEYMLAAGTESGKIVLIPYPSVPEKEVKLL